ncbi:MAG TPA: hypothetical protein VNZ03_35200 [Terriglobales bacterium]|jgi:hypothetical protein|nr:hypothetical protein [Terriglobales bacterium]
MAAPIRGISYLFQIQVGDLVYFAQYTAGALSDRTSWIVNDPIDLRFEKEKMFLKRPDGKEVELWLAKTVRLSQSGQTPPSTTPLAGQALSSNPDDTQHLELGAALKAVRASLPKWRATLSAVDVDSLPIQYRTGKQVELLKSVAVEQLDRIDKTSALLEDGRTSGGFVNAQKSVQLLPGMQDAKAAAVQLSSAFMVYSIDEKTASAASDWAKSVLDMSTDIMSQEKRTEVPVMMLLAARDALLEMCKSKLSQ